MQTISKFDPSWKHYFWTNDIRSLPQEIIDNNSFEIKTLTDEHFILKDKINLLSKNKHFAVSAGDVTRLVILYKYGGVYLDMDYKIVKPINELADNYDYVSGYDGEVGHIGNAFIMAHAGHPVIEGSLKIIERNLNKDTMPEYLKKAAVLFSWIIMSTGPVALTIAFYQNAHKNGNKDINFNIDKIYNSKIANDAKNGIIPSINDINYDQHLAPIAYGNDRFGGTWSNPDFENEDYLANNYVNIFGEIYDL